MRRPPLCLRLLFHPKSDAARSVANELLSRFVEPPSSIGLRVPTFFGPDHEDDLPPSTSGPQSMDLDVAEHTIVVMLCDTRMTRQVAPGDTGDQWRSFAARTTDLVAESDGRHHFFCVALDEGAFAISSERHVVPAMKEDPGDVINEISFQIAVRAIRLLRDTRLNEDDSRGLQAPVSLFLSHAKADLREDRKDPVAWLLGELPQLPIEQWFDSSKISPNERFADRIKQGLSDAAIVVVMLTDQFASRPWCRREVLEAKRLGVPILVCDALQLGEPRSFPYIGNVPTIRWNGEHASDSECRTQARSVVDRAVRESLRHLHNRAVTSQIASNNDIVLSTTPELITLAEDPVVQQREQKAPASCFLYPDPPLSAEERTILSRLTPTSRFETPLSRIAAQQLPDEVRRLAVSISEVSSTDLQRSGLSQRHFRMLSDEVHLYLLMAGAQIGYGGALKGSTATDNNFTLRLFELVRGYSSLAENVSGDGLTPIINSPPWPLSTDYGDEDLNRLSGVATYQPGPVPELGVAADTIFPPREDGKWRLLPDSPEKRYAWARGLTEMRTAMTRDFAARVLTGGKKQGFLGLVAGVLEEAWLSIQAEKPLFIVGAFEGIAGSLVDLLEGRKVPEFEDQHAATTVADYSAAVDVYSRDGVPFVSAAQMALDIRAAVEQKGIAGVLRNGLNDRQNQGLFRLTEPALTAELILQGLHELAAS